MCASTMSSDSALSSRSNSAESLTLITFSFVHRFPRGFVKSLSYPVSAMLGNCLKRAAALESGDPLRADDGAVDLGADVLYHFVEQLLFHHSLQAIGLGRPVLLQHWNDKPRKVACVFNGAGISKRERYRDYPCFGNERSHGLDKGDDFLLRPQVACFPHVRIVEKVQAEVEDHRVRNRVVCEPVQGCMEGLIGTR